AGTGHTALESPIFRGALNEGRISMGQRRRAGQGARGCGHAGAGGSVTSTPHHEEGASMPATLTSKRYKADDAAGAIDLCFEKGWTDGLPRSEEHTSELQSRFDLVCRLLLEKKNK